MDTQVDFQLIFYQRGESLPVTDFALDERSLDEKVVTVTENMKLGLLFQCSDPDAKLYLAGLEMIDISIVDQDGNVYLNPSEEKRILFQDYETHYPLIPGFYPIKVVAFGKNFYSTLQVEPKQMTRTQWEYMKEELERELKGLAQDFIQNQFGLGLSHIRAIPVKLLYQIELIIKHYKKALNALNDIALKPRYKLTKEYRFTLRSRAKNVDERSQRYQLTHPNQKDLIPVPTNQVDYDLLENRWLKNMVSYFIQILNRFIEAVDQSVTDFEEGCQQLKKYIALQKNTLIKYREKRKAIDKLIEYREKCYLIKRNFEGFCQAHWLGQVKMTSNNQFTNILNLDSRFRVIYQLYREVIADQFRISIESGFSSQWKKTDLLYELWGYLHFCKMLISLGYRPITGWLFNYTKNFFVPTLKPGTRVKFEKDDLTLQLVYNQALPRREEDTDLENSPLFSVGTHNCPDGRIDVYKESVYIGSLVFDFKYRQLDYLWNKYRDMKVISQLRDYRNNLLSPFIYGDHIAESEKYHVFPVYTVWGIYPSKDMSLENRSQEQWRGIVQLLRLCPGDDPSFIAGELEKVIEKIVMKYNKS